MFTLWYGYFAWKECRKGQIVPTEETSKQTDATGGNSAKLPPSDSKDKTESSTGPPQLPAPVAKFEAEKPSSDTQLQGRVTQASQPSRFPDTKSQPPQPGPIQSTDSKPQSPDQQIPRLPRQANYPSTDRKPLVDNRQQTPSSPQREYPKPGPGAAPDNQNAHFLHSERQFGANPPRAPPQPTPLRQTEQHSNNSSHRIAPPAHITPKSTDTSSSTDSE